MPYILSPKVTIDLPALWFEGAPYSKDSIYQIKPGKIPPVNYDNHILKPHSMTHAEAELHVVASGKSLDDYFDNPNFFFGRCFVVKLPGNNYQQKENDIYHWEVTRQELAFQLEEFLVKSGGNCEKILLTTEFYPKTSEGFHNPNYVLTLSLEAAEYLVSLPGFNLYGTSWKSTDFMPASTERPIRKTIFSKAVIFELLDLSEVPQGEYFFVGMPVRLAGASESPVCPILFTREEMHF